MTAVSIQKFNQVQKDITQNWSFFCPVVAIGPSLAKIAISLAQVVHGLAMAIFYAIKGKTAENKDLKFKYLKSVENGLINLGIGIPNLATAGLFALILGISIAVHEKLAKDRAKKQQERKELVAECI